MASNVSTLRIDSIDGQPLTTGFENTHFSISISKRSLLSIQDVFLVYASFPFVFENEPKIAFLKIRQMSENFVDSELGGTREDIVATIDIAAAPYGSMVQYEPNDLESVHQSFHSESLGRDVSNLEILLVDENNDLLNLHGHRMQLMFKCLPVDEHPPYKHHNKRRRHM